MSMSPEVEAEYKTALTRLTIRYGMVVSRRPGVSWVDERATKHLDRCQVVSSQVAVEDQWSEFGDTFGGERIAHGFTVTDVQCDCGQVMHETLRWQADLSEATAAVFTEGLSQD